MTDKHTRFMQTPAPDRPELDALIDAARDRGPMTPQQRREQCISFVYGNLGLSNPRITREMVEAEYDRMYGKLPTPDTE